MFFHVLLSVIKRVFLQARRRVDFSFNVPPHHTAVTISVDVFVRERVMVCRVICVKGVRAAHDRVHEGGRVT